MVWKSDMPDGMGHEADSVLFAISTLLMGIMATNAQFASFFTVRIPFRVSGIIPPWSTLFSLLRVINHILVFGFLSVYQGQAPGISFKMAADAIYIELNVVRTLYFSECCPVGLNVLP